MMESHGSIGMRPPVLGGALGSVSADAIASDMVAASEAPEVGALGVLVTGYGALTSTIVIDSAGLKALSTVPLALTPESQSTFVYLPLRLVISAFLNGVSYTGADPTFSLHLNTNMVNGICAVFGSLGLQQALGATARRVADSGAITTSIGAGPFNGLGPSYAFAPSKIVLRNTQGTPGGGSISDRFTICLAYMAVPVYLL